MGLFNKIGRNVEQFKQTAADAASEQADYECRACGSRFHTDSEECPECGASEVHPADDAESDGEA
jgi:rRNA maturation endonuclease Nob1